jgi:hypothetical protein
VRGHLADLRTEVGHDAGAAAFTARLGTPQAYAAELRTAAGYPAPPWPPAGAESTSVVLALAALVASTLLVVVGVAGVVAVGDPSLVLGSLALAAVLQVAALPALVAGGPRMASVAALPAVRAARSALPPARGVTGFVVSLQPAWWVLRALVAAALGTAVFGGGPLVWLVLAVLLVPLSVLLGHLTRRDRRWLWPVVPLNALAALLVPLLLVPFSSAADPYGSDYEPPSAYGAPGLWQDGERQILDIRPVDSTGTPLTGVYLFDQDGRPIDTGDPCYGGYTEGSTRAVPARLRRLRRPDGRVLARPARPAGGGRPDPDAGPDDRPAHDRGHARAGPAGHGGAPPDPGAPHGVTPCGGRSAARGRCRPPGHRAPAATTAA